MVNYEVLADFRCKKMKTLVLSPINVEE
jgi:hypothetical protein